MTANRLVTLTGAGGAGKTRLAIEVASRLVDAFPDGVWLVELAALSDPRLVPQAAARALALKEQPTRPVIETLSDYLASKRPLLVLDNVEHLLDACVRLVDEILRRCRDVTVLVTIGRGEQPLANFRRILESYSRTAFGPADHQALKAAHWLQARVLLLTASAQLRQRNTTYEPSPSAPGSHMSSHD